MANKGKKISRKEAIDKLCDNIQFFCAEEEVKKAYGVIKDDNIKSFVVRIYEYIQEIRERNEEMREELDFREKLLAYLQDMEEKDRAVEREIVRTREICSTLKTTISLNQAKIKVFEGTTVKDIIDNYALLGSVNLLLGNPLGMKEYENLQFEIGQKAKEEYYNK